MITTRNGDENRFPDIISSRKTHYKSLAKIMMKIEVIQIISTKDDLCMYFIAKYSLSSSISEQKTIF